MLALARLSTASSDRPPSALSLSKVSRSRLLCGKQESTQVQRRQGVMATAYRAYHPPGRDGTPAYLLDLCLISISNTNSVLPPNVTSRPSV